MRLLCFVELLLRLNGLCRFKRRADVDKLRMHLQMRLRILDNIEELFQVENTTTLLCDRQVWQGCGRPEDGFLDVGAVLDGCPLMRGDASQGKSHTGRDN